MADDPFASELSVSLRGRLLLASPSLSDGTFDRSVILMAEHSREDGALGIIVNHRTESCVGDIISDPEFEALKKISVYKGGPLGTSELTFSSISWNPKIGIEFRPRIDVGTAVSLIGKKRHVVHATVGHSAWAPGQLENELQRDTWITLKPTADFLSHSHDLSLWENLLGTISPYHKLLAAAPRNPLLN